MQQVALLTEDRERDDLSFCLSAEETHVHVALGTEHLPVTIDPARLDTLIDQLKELQNKLQWHYGRSCWRSIRVKTQGKKSNKWHLISQLESRALCSQGPSRGYGEHEMAESSCDLWDGTVCRQCVALWTQLIQNGTVRYYQPSSPAQSAEEGGG